MKTIVLCILTIFLSASLFSQPYNVGHREGTSVDSMQQATLMQVFNQSGKIVLTKNITQFSNQSLRISSANFQKGNYFVVVTDGKLQYKNSFMIEAY